MASTAPRPDPTEGFIIEADAEWLTRLLFLLVARYHCGEITGSTYDWAYKKMIERLSAVLTTAQMADLLTQLVQLGEQVDQQLQHQLRHEPGIQLSL